jgi:UrcA family protein
MLTLRTAGLAAAGVLVGVLAAVAAGAHDSVKDDDVPQLTVQYKASQLDSDQGARRLYSRLRSAAERVCPQPTTALINSAIAACREQAVAGAVAKIHSERLAALSNKSPKSG